MQKQQQTLTNQISTNAVASLLNQAPSPFATHISIPTGTATLAPNDVHSISEAFIKSLNDIEKNNYPTSSHSTISPAPKNQSLESELNFGAQQIDLSIPTGTLSKNGIHEFNPKHFRDQDIAFKSALALAARQIKSTPNSPIFCYLTEDQTNLIKWLSESGLKEFGLTKEDLIVITAKHSDDLLWAMEETLHTTKAIALVAHFTLLDNLSAQRLAFASNTNKIPCLLICNHKIEGPNHCKSRWTIQQNPINTFDSETENSLSSTIDRSMSLTLSHSCSDFAPLNWSVKWQSERGRFSASFSEEHTTPRSSLH